MSLLPSIGDMPTVFASFGNSKPYKSKIFDFAVDPDSSTPNTLAHQPSRYGKLPQIQHIFRSDPTSPNVVITIIFGCAIFASLPVLLGSWLTAGMNLNHLPSAVQKAPLAYTGFLGGVLALEGLFFAYYLGMTLFTLLPLALALGTITFISGSRALSEVQDRRLAGKR